MSTTTTTATTATATTSATTTATTCRPPAKKLKLKRELGSSPDANLKLCWRTLNASAICSSPAFPAMRTTRQTRRRRADRFPSLHPNLLPDTVAAPPADHLLPLRGLQKCPPTLGAASPVSQSDRIVVPSKTLPVLGTLRNSTEVASTFAAADARCRRQFLPELLLRPGLFFLQKIS